MSFVIKKRVFLQANRDYLRHYLPIRYPDGQESTLLGLRFTVQPRHFQRSEMRLKCVSTLFNVTNMRSEDMVISSRQESSGLVVVINSGGKLSILKQTTKQQIKRNVAYSLP
ncbi:hypothetical protein AVEN_190878-1 [Araneus ventricosus]|uniref:Uncharacterized protein n=1 Tax=Araneus ventricosus TaxID=182803 RepID=A0A4Y2CQH0_ARAVE|nr:hypothetical protein AVEN_190878-1 [Araneus ventricosus]